MKGYGSEDTRTARFRKQPSNEGDRAVLEEALARELFATWKHTGKKVLILERIEWIEKVYGIGAVKRIRAYMDQMRQGLLL